MVKAPKKAGGTGGEMPLTQHLAELRKRLILCVASVVVGMCVVFAVYNPILEFLLEPYNDVCEEEAKDEDGDCTLLQTDPVEGFNVRLKVSMYGGIALGMPVLLFQMWRFVSPGLYSNEKRHALPFVGSALTLFTLGASLAYWMLPRALNFLGAIGGGDLEQHYSPGKYISLITYMMLAFGAGFQVPVMLVFLQLAGIIQPSTLRRVRRYAIVIIAFISAIATPTGDPPTMVALMVPMYLFYELSILIGSWLTRRQTARLRE